MFTIDPTKAATILTALKGIDQTLHGKDPVEFTSRVFVNAYGEIILLYNEHNFKKIGQMINGDRFQIGRLMFSF